MEVIYIQLLYQLLSIAKLYIMVKLEGLLINLTYIVDFLDHVQITLKGFQFIVLSFVVGKDWNSILQLKCIRVRCIVNQHNIRETSIYYSQIFYMHLVFKNPAVLSIEPVLEYLPIFIQLVENCVSIFLLTGCKNYNFKLLRHILQESYSIRPDIYPKVVHPSLLTLQLDAHL